MVAFKNKSYKFCLKGNDAHSFLKWYIINGAIEKRRRQVKIRKIFEQKHSILVFFYFILMNLQQYYMV